MAITFSCPAAAARHDSTPCDGDPMGLVVRFESTDFGGTSGCPGHTALLQADHPGSAVVPIQECLQTMSMFNRHPDLAEIDDDLDIRYGDDPTHGG
ncbi:hypothetical protein ACFXCZ_27165 [Streptomyces sp. NPDC059396]|uniref:hypothetical protein n=1 Tax=Streptomyces sp. NPDC059396 TaxID=3346819 RepID=UPI0036A5B4F0